MLLLGLLFRWCLYEFLLLGGSQLLGRICDDGRLSSELRLFYMLTHDDNMKLCAV